MAAPPGKRIALPKVQAFVICREIIEDCRTHEFLLNGPFSALRAPGFPLDARLSVYAHMTNGHGEYEVTLELRNSDEDPVWAWQCPRPISLPNPLLDHRFTLYDAILEIPERGRYDLLMLANGEEVARHALHVFGAGDRE